MDKSENRLVQIFEELRSGGYVATQNEFADMLGVHKSTLSSALSGREGSLNPKIIATAERVRRQLIGDDIIAPQAPAPPREVGIPIEVLALLNNQAETIRSQQEVIARLTGAADAKKGAV